MILNLHFSQCPKPQKPDYSNKKNWAALPDKKDAADIAPKGKKDNQSIAEADVFFIHPTSFTAKPKDSFQWNANLKNNKLNKKTDQGTIKFQSSIFNGSCKVYAPRYRQAHYYSFVTSNKDDKQGALDLAYSDVKIAFEFYLKNYNHGRPIVIAAHSQGTVHAARILNEFFANKPLSTQLVAAYLVGMPVPTDSLPTFSPCKDSSQTGCYISWRTFEKGHIPHWNSGNPAKLVCQNPISWRLDSAYVSKEFQQGAVLRNFNKILPHICDAQVHNGYLWITKPKFPGSRFYHNPNYHVGDYNLFYLDVRKNVELRINNFINKNK